MQSIATSVKAVGVPGAGFPVEDRAYDESKDKMPTTREEALLRQLQTWIQHEKDRQAENRYQMALDGDFYDGLQWSEQDAQEIEMRGQAPLVFNQVAVSLNWIIGSEKRNRVDWRVLPRTEDDQQAAEVKTKTLKYVSDVNLVPFVRSQAFGEAAICGLSWLEDSLSDDATADILHAGFQSWRSALHDSYHARPDGRDMRYFVRWKHLDLDVAEAMFPNCVGALRRAAKGADNLIGDDDDELWYLGTPLNDHQRSPIGRRTYISNSIQAAFNTRERVKIYEAWYRVPQQMDVVRGGPFDGELYDPNYQPMSESIERGDAFAQRAVVMRVYRAFFTDDRILDFHESPFKHNDFPFTPIYAFRRQRDGLPYGYVRNQRDPQEDLNKRMSKSLFLLSVNQIITEYGAFSDEKGKYTMQDAIDNASNPQGVFIMSDGSKRFEIRRDYMEEQSQMQHVSLDMKFLQSAAGVTDESLGRTTNATSGRAIEARQDQGSLTTNGIFDNYRLAIKLSGQKQLSNVERFYSMPKVIRLTQEKGPIEWVKINQPEVDPLTGEIRFINDITATKADFIVDEQDFRASMRQAMFDSLDEMIGKIVPVAPQFGVSLLDLLVDLADFPGKQQFVDRIKTLIAEFRGETPKPPEVAAAEAEQNALNMRGAAAKIAKDEASANKADAEADEIRMTIPATAAAMDLENVSQAQAVGGQTPMQPGDRAQLAAKGAPNAGTTPPSLGGPVQHSAAFTPDEQAAPMNVDPTSVAVQPETAALLAPTAPAPATVPPQVQPGAPAISPGVAASSSPVPQAAPDPTGALAQALTAMAQVMQQTAQAAQSSAQTSASVMQGLEGVTATMEAIASSIEGVAQVAANATKTGQDAAKAAAEAATAAENTGKAVAEVGKAVEQVAQVASSTKDSIAGVAQAIAEAKKPRDKTIEFTNAQGKKVRATIKG